MIVSNFYFTFYVPTNHKFSIKKLIFLRKTMDLVLRTESRETAAACTSLDQAHPWWGYIPSVLCASTSSLRISKDVANYFIREHELLSVPCFLRVFATMWRKNITETNESRPVAFQIPTVVLYLWTEQLSIFLLSSQAYIFL